MAQASAIATPTVAIVKPLSSKGTSSINSAAKNWMVLTPMMAPTIRMTAVIHNAVIGESAPAAMGSATAFGESRPATTKQNAADNTKTAESRRRHDTLDKRKAPR